MQCVIDDMRAMALELKKLGYRVYRSKSEDISPFRCKQGKWDYCFYVLNNGVLYGVWTDTHVIYTVVCRYDNKGRVQYIRDDNPCVNVHGNMKQTITTEILQKILDMDEGASKLGECALVPNKSPIRKSGILFYNTLFDENATCHLALGAGFDNCVRGYEEKGKEKCKEEGVNESIIHVDFMIGSDTLDIDAKTKDGKIVPVFRNGDWAF